MLQAGANYLQTPEGKAWLLEDKEYHQDILLKNFESKGSTPKEKLAVMSELGSVSVNGYDILPGMYYYDALSDDGKYLDNEVIKRIDDEPLNLFSEVSAEEELYYEEQLIALAESRGIAEQEKLLNQTSLDSTNVEVDKKEKPSQKGICNVCGCTWTTPCIDEKWGSCWWMDRDETICSHCFLGFNDERN
jgi:hypothetical protein